MGSRVGVSVSASVRMIQELTQISPSLIHLKKQREHYRPFHKTMKTLWSPWRIEHVKNTTPASGCLFEPDGNHSSNKENLLLFRDKNTVVLLNRFPYTNGHLLVAPTRHVSCITELDDQETAFLFLMVKNATTILKKVFSPDGFNIGLNLQEPAGAGIADHIHIHIVPRWQGDHNFITVVGEIRTIPEHIDNTFDKLLPEFKHIARNRP